MRKDKAAHFDIVREQNIRLVKNLLRDNPMSGKTELASMSGISIPTVSAAINTLMENQEVLSTEGTSNGGRPGAVYQINPNYEFFACGILRDYDFQVRIYDACGKEKNIFNGTVDRDEGIDKIFALFDEVRETYKRISVISIGIPGVVLDGTIEHLPGTPLLQGVNIKKELENRYGVRAFVENDINSIVLAEKDKWRNLAHMIMIHKCIGTGIIINGNLIRGVHGCAGELDFLYESKDSVIDRLKKCILSIACVVDISDIAISGDEIPDDVEIELRKSLQGQLPEKRIPLIHRVDNYEELYYEGLLGLAVEYSMIRQEIL